MVKFQIHSAPLPADFHGNAQTFLDALLARLEIKSDVESFTAGPTVPPGNQGPWFKDGTKLFVWDETTATYLPLDLRASHSPQIWAGEVAPDPEKYPLWLALGGLKILGLYVYVAGEWITQSSSVTTGAIGTPELANASVTPDKIQRLAITGEKIMPGIPLGKLERGNPRDFLMMNSAGTAAGWRNPHLVSPLLPLVLNSYVTFPHPFGARPSMADAVLVPPNNAQYADAQGKEYNVEITNIGGVYANSEWARILVSSILYRLRNDASWGTRVVYQEALSAPDWKVKFYLTAP